MDPSVKRSSVPRLIAVGAICTTTVFKVEKISPAPAKVLAEQMIQVVDGMAISAACAFQKLGGQAEVWARLGDDDLGHAARTALQNEGINVEGLRSIAGARSSLATVIVDACGERLVVPFHDPSVDASANWLPLKNIEGADLVHCDVRWPEGAETAMRAAQALGVATMLDGEVAPLETLARLVRLANYAVFSDAGIRAFSGLQNIEACLRWVAGQANHLSLSQNSYRHIGASCGADGYYWLDENKLCHAPAPKVEVIDTLAAGDIFHGAFALALVEGQTIAEAAQFACVAASLKCTRFGGRLGCPTRDEVGELM